MSGSNPIDEQELSIADPAHYISQELITAIYKGRLKQGITLHELSRRTGVSLHLLSEMDQKQKVPSLKTLGKLAKVLSLKVSLAVEEIEDSSYQPLYIGKEYMLIKNCVLLVNGMTLANCNRGERVRVLKMASPEHVQFVFANRTRLTKTGEPSFFTLPEFEVNSLLVPVEPLKRIY